MKVLGIDIGTYSVKVAELESLGGSHYALQNLSEYQLSVDPNKDKSLELIEILRNLSHTHDPLTTRWVLGLPQERVSVHHKQFPFRERHKILKSLAFELEDDLPLDIDDVLYDVKITEFIGSMAEVLTVACPREAIEEILATAKDGGFDPEVVSVEGLALANIYESWTQAPPEGRSISSASEQGSDTVLTTATQGEIILNIGHTHTLVLVYRNGRLVASRSVLWGGTDVAAALANAFQLPFFEAVNVLKTKSFILMNSAGATRDQLLMSKTVASQVDHLMRELRLILLELKAAFHLEYSHIDLLGGVSQIQNLGAYVTQALEVPANLARPLQNMQASGFARVQPTPETELSSAVAVGLAIEALKRPRNPAINLRKEEFARENLGFKLFWEKWRTAAQVGIAGFIIIFVYSLLRDTLATEKAGVVSEKLTEVARENGLKGSKGTTEGIRRHIRKEQNKIRNYEALKELDTYSSALELVAKLAEKFPVQSPRVKNRGIDIHQLKIDNDDLTIEGWIQGADLLPTVKSALEGLARSNSLKVESTKNMPKRPGTAFAFSMKVERAL